MKQLLRSASLRPPVFVPLRAATVPPQQSRSTVPMPGRVQRRPSHEPGPQPALVLALVLAAAGLLALAPLVAGSSFALALWAL